MKSKKIMSFLAISLIAILSYSSQLFSSAIVVPDLKGAELGNFDGSMKKALANYVYAIYKTGDNARVYIRFDDADVTFYPGISGYTIMMKTSPLVVTGYKGATAGSILLNQSKAAQYPFVKQLYYQLSESKSRAGGQKTYLPLTIVKQIIPDVIEIEPSAQYTPDVLQDIIEQVSEGFSDL